MKQECSSVKAKDTNNISYIQYPYSKVWSTRESSAGEEFALHSDICNLGLATDWLSSNSRHSRQNMRPNRLSQKSSMNTALFVNTTIGFSENLFLVISGSYGGHRRHTTVCIARIKSKSDLDQLLPSVSHTGTNLFDCHSLD